MQLKKLQVLLGLTVLVTYAILLVGCGANINVNTPTNLLPSTQNGSVNIIVSDASAEDWATIGVKVLKISLVPQGGGTPVVAYTAPTPAPVINLVQLDQLGEILGNVSVPAGTYTGALLTIGGNPGDVSLTVAADPEPGFAGAPGQAIPAGQ